MVRHLSLLCVLLALVFAGCGGDDDDGGSSGGGGGTTTTEPSGGGGGGGDQLAQGKELFSGTCGSCHTLSDAGTAGTLGPNLDDLKPDKERVLNALETGPGAMPENLFEGAEADAVATYVSTVAGT